MSSLQQAFRLAAAGACLVNEWRDSLFYSAFGVAATTMTMQGDFEKLMWVSLVPILREGLRSAAWQFGPSPQAYDAGVSDNSAEKAKKAGASGIIAWPATMASIFTIASANHKILAFAVSCPYEVFSLGTSVLRLLDRGNGNFGDIPSLYFDKETGMWDWPRKNKGGGITQTQKLVDGFKNLGTKVGTALPAPTRNMARISHQAAVSRLDV